MELNTVKKENDALSVPTLKIGDEVFISHCRNRVKIIASFIDKAWDGSNETIYVAKRRISTGYYRHMFVS